MSVTSPPRAWLGRLAVVFALGLILPLVPTPTMHFSERSVLDKLTMPFMAEAGAEEISEVRAAADEPLGDERVTGSDTDTGEFAAIGVLLDEVPTAPIMLRVKAPDGTWGEWRELALELDGGPDAGTAEEQAERGTIATEPAWVESAGGYELNMASSDVDAAEVAVVRDETYRTVVEATPLADAAETAPFPIHFRSEWGARASNTSAASTLKLAVVHHSVSSNSYSPAQVPGLLRSIQAFHMDGRGWSDIGYNFAVDRFGGIWEARGGGITKPIVGAHSAGFNTTSVGVVVLGNHTGPAASAAAIESVAKVIGWKFALHGVTGEGGVAFKSGGSTKYPAGTVVSLPRVVGHRDVGLTSCPGTIHAQLGTVRSRAQDWARWFAATMGPVGAYGGAVPGPGTLTAIGWVLDLDSPGPVQIRLAITGGRVEYAWANVPRDDIESTYPGQGREHGFWHQFSGLSPGWAEICVSAINRGQGQDRSLGCRSGVVPDPTGRGPSGTIRADSRNAGIVDVVGNATDPDGGSVGVRLTVDGVVRRTVSAPESGAAYSAGIAGVAAGVHQVCAIGVNNGIGQNMRMDCRNVRVGAANPVGALDGISGGDGVITTAGWAYDPNTRSPLQVALIIDGRWHNTWASRSRWDWKSRYPAYGDQHGFAIGAEVAAGTRWACVAAIGEGGGGDTILGCRNVVVK